MKWFIDPKFVGFDSLVKFSLIVIGLYETYTSSLKSEVYVSYKPEL